MVFIAIEFGNHAVHWLGKLRQNVLTKALLVPVPDVVLSSDLNR